MRKAAAHAAALATLPEEETRGTVDVTTRTKKAKSAEAGADEAQKGYDLLIVGIDKMRTTRGPQRMRPERPGRFARTSG